MNTNDFNHFLSTLSENPIQVIDKTIGLESYVPIEISANNKDLSNFDISSAEAWEIYINNYLSKNNAEVAYGGYLEKRNLYDRSDYFMNQTEENKRNIHLGIDLWSEANTKVLAVLDGEIHSFKYNDNYGDYGPTIILKHKIENQIFYSLYGHLTLSSIENIKVGDKFKQGSAIGFLGSSDVNGEYAPHLHFQIIRNMQENFGDYAGVSSVKDLDFYKENCPNPNLLLKL